MAESLLTKYPHLNNLLEKKNHNKDAGTESSQVVKQEQDSSSSHGDKPLGLQKFTKMRSHPPSKPPAPRASAEKLFAEAVEADNDRWIVFTIERPGRQLGELRGWLEKNKPSRVRRSDGVGWISVTSSSGDAIERDLKDEAKAEWDSLEAGVGKMSRDFWEIYPHEHVPRPNYCTHDSKHFADPCLEGERNMETVNRLASKYCYKEGKWILSISTEFVDQVWKLLAVALVKGDLSPAVQSIKVSPRASSSMYSTHVIIIHNYNYQDTTQVMRAEFLIRAAGLRGSLGYKPDIFSHLGIYQNNIWGFKPSIYTSKMKTDNKNSVITVTGTGKQYKNTSEGLQIPENESLDKIVADISTPEPDFFADYNPDDFKDEENSNTVSADKKLDKIVADISAPEPNLLADNPKDINDNEN